MPAGFTRKTFSLKSMADLQKKSADSPRSPRFYVTTGVLLLAEDLAEKLPGLAVEARHLHLLDRREVRRAGVDADAGQRRVGHEVLEARRLLHDVRPRQVVAGLLEHLVQDLGDGVAVDVGGVDQ